jgi:hypothetical protein
LLKKQNYGRFTSFFWEVLAIVVGLTISFMIDEWRDDIKLDDKRQAILSSIRLDLEEDAAWTVNGLEWNTGRIQVVTELLDPEIVEASETDSLIHSLRETFPYFGFFTQGYTFESLTMELTTLVANPELRRALNNYYHKTYEFVKSNERISYDFSMDRHAYLRSAPFVFPPFGTKNTPRAVIKNLDLYQPTREQLLNLTTDPIYRNQLRQLLGDCLSMDGELNRLLKEASKTIDLVNQEIESIE